MESFLNLGDDGTALVGCAIALLVCGTMMSLSYYLGRAAKKVAPQQQKQPETYSIATRLETQQNNDRKAA